MMRQNYKNEDVCSKLQMKTIDITQRGCVISLWTHPLCIDKAGMLSIDLHITDY